MPQIEAQAGTRKLELLGLPRAEWEERVSGLLRELGEPAYRSRQLRDWVFQRSPADFAAMSDLPQGLRKELEARAVLHPLRLLEERVSKDGTRKYLWARAGSGPIESVLIPDGGEDQRPRVTYCISTQAGCPVKCTFCATGYGGFEGQLSPAEIVDQVVEIRRISGRLPTNIVYMGMGEPLLNFPSTLRSLEVLADPERLALGARRLTVSTVGVPDRIVELGRRFPQVKLALSLHAARDELRSQIIPLNRKHPVNQVLAAVREHHRITEKLPTFEYVVLPGVNDTERDAREIGGLLTGLPSRINLIEFNPFPGVEYRKPPVARLLEFRRWILKGFPGTVTIRRSRGEDIHGGCGQLTLSARGGPAAEPA
jgi:23S rRNA (adenine2503-C2)-methyltransferase